MTTSDSLIERLEAAEVGSRELDALMWAHFHPERVKVVTWHEPYGGSDKTQVWFKAPPGRRESVTNDRGPYPHATPATTSLDAALALAERVLPNTDERIAQPVVWAGDGKGFWRIPAAQINFAIRDAAAEGGFAIEAGKTVRADATTPALALCIAILKAKEASQ
jgi:hypothetical protein